MNPPNGDFQRLAVDVCTDEKKKLIAYCTARGTNISTVLRNLLEQLLDGKIKPRFKK